MVGLGFAMLALALVGLWRWWRGTLEARWYLRAWVAMIPSGFLAVLTGWWVAEVGRQPWVVYGVMRTAQAASPLPVSSVAISLATFVIVYLAIFGAGIYYLLKLFRAGPGAAPAKATVPYRTPARPLSVPQEAIED
jgi:cytochrome d ubiquinol oxidase subunit I